MLDIRSRRDYQAGHLPGSAHIPWEEFAQRKHELPEAAQPVLLGDVDPARLAAAAQWLQARGYTVETQLLTSEDCTETGPARTYLWRPSPFLREALDLLPPLLPPLPLPPAGKLRALDVACGSGREAVTLALRGYEVTALDHLPDALEKALDLARRLGVVLHPLCMDVEKPTAFPRECFDLIVVFRYLHRPLFPRLGEWLKPGGHLIYETFHQSDPRNRRASHLVGDGELSAAFPGWQVLLQRDGVGRGERVFSQLLARK